MDISNLIEKLNKKLTELNNEKNSDFFTSDNSSSWAFKESSLDETTDNDISKNNNTDENIANTSEIDNSETDSENSLIENVPYPDIEPNTDVVDITILKERRLLTAQNMFKKSIRISLKSFLISLSLSFLNLFI